MRHTGGARSEEGPQKWDDNRKQSRRSLSNSRHPGKDSTHNVRPFCEAVEELLEPCRRSRERRGADDRHTARHR